MSADLLTNIQLKGTHNGLFAMLKVLKKFGTENIEQYKVNHDYMYLKDVRVNGRQLNQLSDDALDSLLDNVENEVQIQAIGPYGRFGNLRDSGLFEALAEASPDSWFYGDIDGFISDVDVSLNAELKDRKLYLTEQVLPDDVVYEEYSNSVRKKLPYETFCKLFKVNTSEFDEDDYSYFINDVIGDCGFDIDYEQFIECCRASFLKMNEYEEAVDTIKELNLMDVITFRYKEFDDSNYTIKTILKY